MSTPSKSADGRPGELTLIFTCVGRRIELIQAFRAAARRLGVTLRVVAVDHDATAPGLFCADVPLLAPAADDPGYVQTVADVARRYGAAALIPTIDTDLRVLSANRAAFVEAGCVPLIADPGVIHICRDKVETFRFLRRAGIDTPQTWTAAEVRAASPEFPLFVKPRDGSASRLVHRIDSPDDLAYHLARVRDPIVQEFVPGVEHTLDVYVGLTGEPRCVVPRARWQVRSGEVSKGAVVKDAEIMAAGAAVVRALGNSARGLVTLQCIVTPSDDAPRRIRFIEINPRFGGGAPLSIAAGADFPRWLIQELRGENPRIEPDGFRHGLCMYRYDWSVLVQLGDDLVPRLTPPANACPDWTL